MTPDEWRYQIEMIQQQAAALAPGGQWPGTLTEALTILQICLEELHVAAEEMWQPHEAITIAQQAVVGAYQQYQQLFDLAPDAHLVTDSHGVIQEANQAATTLLNVSQGHLVGQPFALFVPQEDRCALRTRLATVDTAPRRQTWEGRLQTRCQPPFAVELTVVTMHAPQDEHVRLLWLFRNIRGHTQAEDARRHAYEELEHRVRERTAALAAETHAVKRLAYRISQDLRAPLITMRGFASELRVACDMLKTALPPLLPPVEAPQCTAVSHTLDHDIPEALGFIEAAITQMDSHIQALLDFSRR